MLSQKVIAKNMRSPGGKKRVVITNVSPKVEEGRFPAKAVIDEDICISADIVGDGHDVVAASAYVRHAADRLWRELPMRFDINDRWQATFSAERMGTYTFKVAAWVDHYTTWKNGLKKKYEAGQDIAVELQIGAGLLRKAASANKREAVRLNGWVSQLEEGTDSGQAVSLASNPEVAAVMYKHRYRDTVTEYPTTYRIEVERRKAGFSTWYELFPRSTSPKAARHGTFNDVANLLPRIARMGFDVLYFPPIHPIGEVNRKGKNNSLEANPGDPGSPWAIGSRLGGHKAIHPELGTLDDFKALVKATSDHGIEIAMDIAYQCAPDHPYVKEHPEWFTWRPDGTVQFAENPPKKYEDILPFNFESDDWENLWKELKSVIDYWVDAGIRVFRIDNPHTKAFAFWQWMIGEVRAEHPDVIFLAEAFTRPRVMERLAKAGFNQSYTYFTWRNTKQEIEQYMIELTCTEMRYYFRPNFWPNTPDILPPILTHGGENAHIMRVILAGTLSSNYGLYGPVYEFGINTPHGVKEEYLDNEKYEIKHWNWDQYTRIGDIITRLNRIRRENAALQSTWNIQFADTSNDQIISYVKTDASTGNQLIVVVNLDAFHTQGAHIRIPMAKLGMGSDEHYMVKDLLGGGKYRWFGDFNYVELNPYLMPAHIFTIIKKQNHD